MLVLFLLQKSFTNYFYLKTPNKYLYNIYKSIYQLKTPLNLYQTKQFSLNTLCQQDEGKKYFNETFIIE
jgi:hypothetical protein